MAGITEIIAQQLTRYQFAERLGVGGMASVYKATDTRLKRPVAIKIMHEHLTLDTTFQQRFEAEAQFVASLSHPNIIQIFDYNTLMLEGHALYYMVMPYLPGPTLADLLDNCRTQGETLTHKRIAEIIGNIASALDYAHERGMTHRDVKPANILFDESGTAILTDFGIARLKQGQGFTQDGTIVGTPAYISPEQAQGFSGDSRSDLYALGVILFEMLTGHPPFEDESAVQLLLKHTQTPPPLVSESLSKPLPALDFVLETALAKDPNERYQTGADLTGELQAVFRDEGTADRIKPLPIETRPATAQTLTMTLVELLDTSVVKPVKRYPLVAGTTVLALIGLLLVARLSLPNSAASPTIATPTAASSMVDDILFFDTRFAATDEVVALWDLEDSNMVQRAIVDDQLRITNTEASTAVNTLLDPVYVYDNIFVEMEATLLGESEGDASGYGIVFRYQDPANYNVFAVDGEGRFSIWTRESAAWTELRNTDENWTPHPAINPIGQANTLQLTTWGETLIGMVNGEAVVMLEEDTFSSGSIGVYLATTRRGTATIAVDRYSVSAAEPVAESMTADQ